MSSAAAASRISHHHLLLGLGLYSRNLHPPPVVSKYPYEPRVASPYRYRRRMIAAPITDFRHPVGCFHPNYSLGMATVSDILSQLEDGIVLPTEGLSPVTGGIVALGKFDALHIGHRELAIQASQIGVPFLLSFVGIAEVLGWESRAPIVAKCDRKPILSSWASHCNNKAPKEYEIEFSTVRHLTPREFVVKLSNQLGVLGVVAGENYRFGYKAAGDASELVKLCKEYGLGAYIIGSVMDKNRDAMGSPSWKERGQVSSTRVRHALVKGDMKYVSELLGRRHRLVLLLGEKLEFAVRRHRLSAPKTCLLNLAPKDGCYDNCLLWIDNNEPRPCRAILDATHIHLELEELGTLFPVITCQNGSLLGIEFHCS